MTLDQFLANLKADIDQFEILFKTKYPDLGSDGSFTDADWFDQFLAWSIPENAENF